MLSVSTMSNEAKEIYAPQSVNYEEKYKIIEKINNQNIIINNNYSVINSDDRVYPRKIVAAGFSLVALAGLGLPFIATLPTAGYLMWVGMESVVLYVTKKEITEMNETIKQFPGYNLIEESEKEITRLRLDLKNLEIKQISREKYFFLTEIMRDNIINKDIECLIAKTFVKVNGLF